MSATSTNDAPVIQIRDVTKIYEMGDGTIQVRALDGVSLDIHDGEYVAIMGASGSGKSTLMNIIGCLDVPTEGSYHIDGQAVESMSNDRLADIRSRKVGFVFQTHNLLPRLTALANVELPMMYGHWPNRRQRAENALELVNLADRMDHRPTELSGGQQQRVGIARALVKEPSVLLADEPTGNLDTANTAEILNIISDLNHQNGITVIVVTHESDVAARADRVITLSDGHIIADESNGNGRAESPLPIGGEGQGEGDRGGQKGGVPPVITTSISNHTSSSSAANS